MSEPVRGPSSFEDVIADMERRRAEQARHFEEVQQARAEALKGALAACPDGKRMKWGPYHKWLEEHADLPMDEIADLLSLKTGWPIDRHQIAYQLQVLRIVRAS